MNVLIFTGGSYDQIEFYKEVLKNKDDATIIAVDGGGTFLLNIGVMPDYAMGDFDTISKEDLQKFEDAGVPLLRHNPKKNETDTELAVAWCIEHQALEVTLLGALGSRFDHSFGNIHLLNVLMKSGIYGEILDPENRIFLVEESYGLNLEAGITMSSMAYTDVAEGIVLEGFEYPVDNGKMDHLTPGYGISNVTLSGFQNIEVKKGVLIVDIIGRLDD